MNQQIASSRPWLRYIAVGCLLPAAIAVRTPAQDAASPEKKIPVENAPANAKIVVEDDELLVLSPFTVSTKQDIGYRASSTLAGSRLNSKIDDLASPITVITKQQLEDTGSHDLNDVFLYEANTEGSLNYTKIQLDRSGLKDDIGGSATNGLGAQTSTTANRIRGLVAADITWNFYSSIPRVRGDSYNVSSMEISRGPNSILSGLGSPSGILNQSIGVAQLVGSTNEVGMAIGSYGSYRLNMSTNQVLLKDKLAIYVAALYDDREFARKPSYDLSRRQTGGLTYKPLPKTKISGFVENYLNNARLPNQLTPRDGITPWVNAGRPTWDPMTKQVTFLDGNVGQANYANLISTTYVNSLNQLVPTSAINPALTRISGDTVLTDRRSSLFIPGLGFVSGGRPSREINSDGTFFWVQSQATVYNIYNNPLVPTAALRTNEVTGSLSATGVFTAPTMGTGAGSPYDVWNRRMTSSALAPAPASYDLLGSGVYVAPAINNKKLYDWEKVNITAANHGETRNSTYNLEFEQEITPDLYFAAGWFRQDFDSLESYPLSQLQTATIYVDTNKNLINGLANPNYLRPYLDTTDPDIAQSPESNEIYRAMLAYNLDFTKNAGWSRFLGRHRILAYAQHQEDIQTQIRYRLAFSDPSDPRFLQSNSALPFAGATGGVAARPAGYRYSGNASSSRQVYYVGDANSGVGYAPSTTVGNPAINTTETSTITSYNYQTGAWEQAPVTYGSEVYDAGNGFWRSQKIVNSLNLTAQSYWWNERIITTVGVRRDKWMGRNTTTGTDANGNVLGASTAAINTALYPVGSWRLNENTLLERWAKAEFLKKTTGSFGVVAKPLPWFSLLANMSDNFNPPSAAQVDIFGKKLPIPTAKSKDYGIAVNLLENKLTARLSFFDTKFEGDRSNGDIGTMIGRLIRQDTSNLLSWAQAVVRIRSNVTGDAASDLAQTHAPNGTAPTTDWNDPSKAGNALSVNQTAIVDSMMGGLSSSWPNGANVSSTQNAQAKGAELELVYNPLSNWNIKLTVGKQKTTYSDILPEYDAWYSQRLAFWKSAVATGLPAAYSVPFTEAGSGKQWSLANFWSGYGFGETNISTGTNGSNPEDWYSKVVAPYVTTARTLQGAAPYGQRQWRANILTNYLFTRGVLKNFGVGGAVRWEDKSVIGYRGILDSNPAYATPQWTGVNPNSPIYDTDVGVDAFRDLTHLDLWVSYTFKMWSDKIRTKIQFNVTDALENGRLAPVFANYDGTPVAFRIVDERRWQLSAKFEF